MPEGNEIHRWAARHEAAFGGRPVRVDGPQGRFTDSDVIDGRKLQRVMAVGKHLGYDFGKDLILHVHLGLQGDFTEGSGPLPEVRGALRLRLWSAAKVKLRAVAWVELRGPTDCSVWSEEQWETLLGRLGVDALNSDAPDKAFAKMAKSKKS